MAGAETNLIASLVGEIIQEIGGDTELFQISQMVLGVADMFGMKLPDEPEQVLMLLQGTIAVLQTALEKLRGRLEPVPALTPDEHDKIIELAHEAADTVEPRKFTDDIGVSYEFTEATGGHTDVTPDETS